MIRCNLMMQYHANVMPCDCITGKAAKEAEAAIHKMRKHIRQNVCFSAFVLRRMIVGLLFAGIKGNGCWS